MLSNIGIWEVDNGKFISPDESGFITFLQNTMTTQTISSLWIMI